MGLIEISQEEFLLQVLDGLDDEKCVTYLYNKDYHSPLGCYKDPKTQNYVQKLMRIHSFDELFKQIKCRSDIEHYLPALMLKTTSASKGDTKDYIREKRVMVFDFDVKISPNDIKDRFAQVGLVPNYIVKSRHNGYHAYLLHSPVSGTKKAMTLWESIQRALVLKLDSDSGAMGIRHLFYVPKHILLSEDGKVHEIDDLVDLKKSIEDETCKYRERPSGDIVSISSNQIWNDPAIVALLNADFDFEQKSRNHAVYTIALLHKYMAKKEHRNLDDAKLDCLEYLTTDWLRKVTTIRKPSGDFTALEIRDTVNSAFHGKSSGPTTKWIEELAEIRCEVNLYGDTYIRKDKSDGGRNNLRENVLGILSFLKQKPFVGLQKDLIRELIGLGLAKSTITRLMPILKEEDYISYETKSGSKTGATYSLTKKGQEFLEFKIMERTIYDSFGESNTIEDDGTIAKLFSEEDFDWNKKAI